MYFFWVYRMISFSSRWSSSELRSLKVISTVTYLVAAAKYDFDDTISLK